MDHPKTENMKNQTADWITDACIVNNTLVIVAYAPNGIFKDVYEIELETENVHRVYLGPSLWTGEFIGYICSRTRIGLCFSVFCSLWRVPMGIRS